MSFSSLTARKSVYLISRPSSICD